MFMPGKSAILPFPRFLIAALLALCGLPASAQLRPADVSPVNVVLQTEEGAITVALDQARAPITSRNFLRYVDERRFDGTAFYRSLDYGDGIGLIQGGTRGDSARKLPPIVHESTTMTGLAHVEGAISMARYAPGSATGDFFITTTKIDSLDANPAQPGDNEGFAVFGRVVSGMDVVLKILVAPRSETDGEGSMRGQMLAPPVRILRAHRE